MGRNPYSIRGAPHVRRRASTVVSSDRSRPRREHQENDARKFGRELRSGSHVWARHAARHRGASKHSRGCRARCWGGCRGGCNAGGSVEAPPSHPLRRGDAARVARRRRAGRRHPHHRRRRQRAGHHGRGGPVGRRGVRRRRAGGGAPVRVRAGRGRRPARGRADHLQLSLPVQAAAGARGAR